MRGSSDHKYVRKESTKNADRLNAIDSIFNGREGMRWFMLVTASTMGKVPDPPENAAQCSFNSHPSFVDPSPFVVYCTLPIREIQQRRTADNREPRRGWPCPEPIACTKGHCSLYELWILCFCRFRRETNVSGVVGNIGIGLFRDPR